MIEVCKNLFVGDQKDCRHDGDMAVIHACKYPCHQTALGYKYCLPASHPNYLTFERDNHLYLNMVDWSNGMPDHKYYGEIYKKSVEFIQKHINDRGVLVHCNVGKSRSVSIAMVYVSFLEGYSFEEVKNNFEERFPGCVELSRGLDWYLREYWYDLIKSMG